MHSNRKAVISWALYDCANSVFALSVVSAFFPLLFRQYWNGGGDGAISTLRLGVANSAASVAVALLAPVLGAAADRGSAKLRYLAAFAALAVVMTALLALVPLGGWRMALALFVVASIGFAAANIFYDALIVDVAQGEHLHYVSALGFGLGYLGGGLLLACNVAMMAWPRQFGLVDSIQAVRVSFVLVAAWWIVFAIPLLLSVREAPGRQHHSSQSALKEGLRELAATWRQLRNRRSIWLFLLAYWLYIDGVYTIARMGIDYGLALGFDANHLIAALLIAQFVGFPAALAFGYAGERLGAKPAIFAALAIYTGATVWGYFMTGSLDFYLLAVAIGLAQGGVQSLSRSFYARLIPCAQSGAFFGLYNMAGRFAAVLGPLLMGGIGVFTGNPRLPILSLLPLLIVGALLLSQIQEPGKADSP